MKTYLMIFLVLLVLMSTIISAENSRDLREKWLDIKVKNADLRAIHEEAKAEYQQEKTPENEQKFIDTGKDVLHGALDEVEAWLNWKNAEAKENSKVPDEIKENIASDVETNLNKIDDLRIEVDSIDNPLEMGVTFLRMLGAYNELMVDVARNTGSMWVYIADSHADKIEEFEVKLRTAAEKIKDNDSILEKLDKSKELLESGRKNIDRATSMYDKVILPGTPFINFSEGNTFLNAARTDLVGALGNLLEAFGMIIRGA